MQIKMVGLDLDGTLLNSKKELTPFTKEVIAKAIEKGVHVLVATGRPFTGVPLELREFPGMRYALTANGARILDTATGEILNIYYQKKVQKKHWKSQKNMIRYKRSILMDRGMRRMKNWLM